MKRTKSMIISFCVVGILVVVILIYYFGAFYPRFSKLDKREEFEIPGLDEGFVPQGLDYNQTTNSFIMCGYMSDGSPSRVYLISDDATKYVTLTINGEPYYGHAGGVATDGKHLWVSGDKKVETLRFGDLLNASNGDSINIIESTVTGNGCDFIKVYENQLIVGEFYRKNKYETPDSHHINQTKALAFAYKIDKSSTSGIGEKQFVLTLPNNAQGIAIIGEKVVVSTSWAIRSSELFVYNNSLNMEASGMFEGLPLYELSDKNLIKIIKAPAMAEEIAVKDGRVYINFESACKKYKLINRTRIKNVISIEV